MSSDVTILVATRDRALGEALAVDIREVLRDLVDVAVVDGVDAALGATDTIRNTGGIVPVVLIDLDRRDGHGVDVAVALHEDDELDATRLVLVTSKASLRGVDIALQRGAVHGMITRPWTKHGLGQLLEAQLATSLLEHAPDRLATFDELLDADDRERARLRIEQRRAAPGLQGDGVPPLLDSAVDEAELEAQMVSLLDRALGHPPRIRVGPGTVLIESGEDVGGIYVILEGKVRLSSRPETGGRILHEDSTGSILGLLSLASHRRAMLQCRAVTDVLAIPVTIDQLATALDAEPALSSLLNRVLIGSLARRLRRSDELQIELDQSLAALSEARAQLVASARFTTLGEISAGMAHELNNPTAALVRAVDHLIDDVAVVVDDPRIDAAMHRQIEASTESTSVRRALRRELTTELGDPALARRLIDMGVVDVAEARAVAELDAEALVRIEAAARLGQTIRNAATAAERIELLVHSLRAYARGDDGRGALEADVDVPSGLDDAVRLVGHRLGSVDIERDFGDVPPITARPGALQQVWTNLITNALDALDDRGRLGLRVAMADHDHIRIDVIDDGPGVPGHLQSRIFEPRFTTKNGRVQFGLGLGLSISRQIVEEHGGTITLDSRPGYTRFSVELPIGGPP